MTYTHLTDRELARLDPDPIFASPLELELHKRFCQSVALHNEIGVVAEITRQIDTQLKLIHSAAPRGLSDTSITDPISRIERLVRELAAIAQEES